MSNEVGVVIGRFQVESLHEGHRYLINEAFRNHKKVIIFVGISPIQGTKHDPLDFPTRRRMLSAAYPDAEILPQYDHLSDKAWSDNLDTQIKGIVPNLTGAKLYGGRDSFQKHYRGQYTAVNIDSGIEFRSGSKQREDIGKVVRSSEDFRAGIIYSTQNSWPYTQMCVDIAVVKKHKKSVEPFILLGRKDCEDKWRLPGGKVEKGQTLEYAAARELLEETGLISDVPMSYVGSFPVGDWRFKNAGEIGVLTALFIVEYTIGAPQAFDDLAEVKWVKLSDAEDLVVKSHRQLIAKIKEVTSK